MTQQEFMTIFDEVNASGPHPDALGEQYRWVFWGLWEKMLQIQSLTRDQIIDKERRAIVKWLFHLEKNNGATSWNQWRNAIQIGIYEKFYE